jgi:hypothetical protein
MAFRNVAKKLKTREKKILKSQIRQLASKAAL